jgi:LmbE family N-acetylglucosaminyl deacetylase
MFQSAKVLFLGAHPDDLEFAAGGLISRLSNAPDLEIRIAIFSDCNASLPVGFADDSLIEEFHDSMATLGCTSEQISEFKYPVREFSSYRQSILQQLIDLRSDFSPDIVFAPSKDDLHQDHMVLGFEAFRAFKLVNLFEYTHPWNSFEGVANTFFEITKSELQVKIKSIGCYRSQSQRTYSTPLNVSSIASYYGLQGGFELAEGFRTLRLSMPFSQEES